MKGALSQGRAGRSARAPKYAVAPVYVYVTHSSANARHRPSCRSMYTFASQLTNTCCEFCRGRACHVTEVIQRSLQAAGMTSLAVAADNDVTGLHEHDSSASSSGHDSRTTISTRKQTTPITHYNTFNGPFFSTIRSPRRQYFIIHPEWASETIVPAKWLASAAAQQQQGQQASSGTWAPPRTGRRCHSAPPGSRSRNPITWEHWWP